VCSHIIAASVLSSSLIGAFPADEPKDPFAQAPAGKVSIQAAERGLLVVSNVPGNRYTYELVGKKIDQVRYEDKENPHKRLWSVDGIVLQSVPLPLAREGNLGYVVEVLLAHLLYETDYQAKGGYAEVEKARQWLEFPTTGAPALYWELRPAGKAPGLRKLLLANAVNGRNVVFFSTSILPDVDEAKAKKLLTETVLTLKCYEEDAARQLVPANAQAMLVNDELATRDDRKAPGAVVVKPEVSTLLVRMSLELNARGTGHITCVHDGKSGHAITLWSYDPEKKRFHYLDTMGNRSFLQEDNNRAGVHAERDPKSGDFTVTESELQSVLEAVISVPFYTMRPYFRGGDLAEALKEYRLLQMLNPKSEEVSEAFLLQAATILAQGKEDARALHMFAVCRALHEKSARANAGIAEVFAKTAQTKSAIEFYEVANQALPDDPSLDDAQRKEFASAWESARKALAAKPAPPAKP
jgi:hypothetical protein